MQGKNDDNDLPRYVVIVVKYVKYVTLIFR